MSYTTVRHDRIESNKRIHIERLIGLAKTYKILTAQINNVKLSFSTELVTIIAYLCNFRKCIISEHA